MRRGWGAAGRGRGVRGLAWVRFGGFGLRWRGIAGHLDAEGAGQGAQEAAGAGDFGEEAGAIRGGEEGFQLGGAGAGVVMVKGAGEPGLASGEAGLAVGPGGAGRGWVGFGAGFGDGVGLPAGVEGLEAGGGSVEVVPDAHEKGRAGAVSRRDGGDDGLEAVHDGAEQGAETCHCR